MSLFLALAALIATAGCGGTAAATEASPATPSSSAALPHQPGADWETVAPASVGLDPTELAAIAKTAEAASSNCLVVVRHGKIAGEWYFRGTNADTEQDIFSVTKSVTSTLTGIAQDDGDLKITDPADTWIPSWANTPASAVSVQDLLSMDSGRQWSLALDYGQLIRAKDRTAFAVGLGQTNAPGQVWAYNNAAVQTMQQVLTSATGQDPVAFARQRLFGPLGMTHSQLTRDGAGNAQMFSGLHSTCQDLARFGQLALDHGEWHGQQIVSAEWLKTATATSSTPLNAAYGYLWWLNHEGVIGNPRVASDLSQAGDQSTTRGRLVPGAPDDTFWAVGLGNQVIQVDPATDTVVVRLGPAQANPSPPTFGPAQAATVVTRAVTVR